MATMNRKREADSEPPASRATKKRALPQPTITKRMTRLAFKKLAESNDSIATLDPGLPMGGPVRRKNAASPAKPLGMAADSTTSDVQKTKTCSPPSEPKRTIKAKAFRNRPDVMRLDEHGMILGSASAYHAVDPSPGIRPICAPLLDLQERIRRCASPLPEDMHSPCDLLTPGSADGSMETTSPGGLAPVAYMGEPFQDGGASSETLSPWYECEEDSFAARLERNIPVEPRPQPGGRLSRSRQDTPGQLRTGSDASTCRSSLISPRSGPPRSSRQPVHPSARALPLGCTEEGPDTSLVYPDRPSPSKCFDPKWCFPKPSPVKLPVTEEVASSRRTSESENKLPKFMDTSLLFPPGSVEVMTVDLLEESPATRAESTIIERPSMPAPAVTSTGTPAGQSSVRTLTECTVQEAPTQVVVVEHIGGSTRNGSSHGHTETKSAEDMVTSLLAESLEEMIASESSKTSRQGSSADESLESAPLAPDTRKENLGETSLPSYSNLGLPAADNGTLTAQKWQQDEVVPSDMLEVNVARRNGQLSAFPPWPYTRQTSYLPVEEEEWSLETYDEDCVIY